MREVLDCSLKCRWFTVSTTLWKLIVLWKLKLFI